MAYTQFFYYIIPATVYIIMEVMKGDYRNEILKVFHSTA